jgi:hypothetical protein
MRNQRECPKFGSWVGSVVTFSSDEDCLRGVVVDVVCSRPSLEITHAVVAIDLGIDFPTVYQPIGVGLLQSAARSNSFAVNGSRDAIAEVLPGFVQYEINVVKAGSQVMAPTPRSCRIH